MKTNILLVSALAAIYSQFAFSADTTLDEVVITGQRLEETLPQQLAQYGTKVDVVTAEQVQNGGYVDIATTLQSLVPGLYVSSKNGPFDYVDISLQGSRTSDVLWLVDGVRINNRLYGGTTPLDSLPSSIIERLEVLDGGQALFYGTQATAGAINIVTKLFTDQPDGSFGLGADDKGGRHLDAYFRDAIGKNQFVVYGSSDESSGYQPFRDSDYQPSATDRQRGYNVMTLGAKYAYEFSDNLRFDTMYQHTDGKLDNLSPRLVASRFNERDENLISSKIDYKVNDVAEVYVKGYGHWWYSHYTELDNEIGNPGTVDVSDDRDFWGYKDYGLNVMTKLALNRGFEYLAGYDFQSYSGNDAVLVISQQSEHVNALFAQVRTTPDLISNAHLALGVRYNDPSVGQAATVWNASGQFDFSDQLFVRANLGTSFRLPTAEELFANDPDDERGNPNLKPEQGRNLNVSVGGKLGSGDLKFNWEAIGFWRDTTNLITFDGFDAATDQSLAENVPGTIKVRGFEVDLGADFNKEWTTNLSFTYNHAKQDGSDVQLVRIPMQQYKASVDYHPSQLPIGFTATLDHVGSVYASVWDGVETYGDYTLMDLAARVFLDDARRNTINVRLENVFNKEYASSLGSGKRDSDGSSYTYWNLGVPRTLSARYIHKF